MSGLDHAAVRFFDEQFQRQIREEGYELNPFESLALRHARGDLLDLGCGLGNLSIEAARKGCRVVAVDASPTAIARIRREAESLGPHIRPMEADLETYAIDTTYDTVVAIGVVMFFDRPRATALLDEIRGAVRPGGISVVNALTEGTTYTAMFDPDRHCLFRSAEIVDAFVGWEILESTVDRLPAAGGTTKVFTTVIARRPDPASGAVS